LAGGLTDDPFPPPRCLISLFEFQLLFPCRRSFLSALYPQIFTNRFALIPSAKAGDFPLVPPFFFVACFPPVEERPEYFFLNRNYCFSPQQHSERLFPLSPVTPLPWPPPQVPSLSFVPGSSSIICPHNYPSAPLHPLSFSPLSLFSSLIFHFWPLLQ